MRQGQGHCDSTANAEKPGQDLQHKASGPDFEILPGPAIDIVDGVRDLIHQVIISIILFV